MNRGAARWGLYVIATLAALWIGYGIWQLFKGWH